MKHFYPALLLSLFLLQIISCKKEVTVVYNFTQYTATDFNGVIMNTPDSTDWTYDTSWTAKDSSFLYFADTLYTSDTSAGSITVYPAYPNPNQGIFRLEVNVEKECKMKAALVNTNLEILSYSAYILTSGNNGFTFDFSTLTALHKGQFYRMYYGFYTSRDSLYYKGHGDLKIE